MTFMKASCCEKFTGGGAKLLSMIQFYASRFRVKKEIPRHELQINDENILIELKMWD